MAFSFKELIPNYEVEVNGKVGNRSLASDGRSYKDDVYKSLDDVVQQRGIVRPPSYNGSNGGRGNSELPGTGINNARNLKDSYESRGSREVVRLPMDPRTTSLDDMFTTSTSNGGGSGRRFNRDRGGGSAYDAEPTFSGANAEIVGSSCGRRFFRGGGGGRADSSGTVKLRAHLDPKTVSLDDLIVEENEDDGSGRRFNKRKPAGQSGAGAGWSMDIDSVDGQGFKRPRFNSKVFTPYRTVEFLAQLGMVIHMKVGKLVEENPDVSHLWRCVIQCGAVSGKAESQRKTVAREIACREFLKTLKEEYPEGKIPFNRIPDEIFLDPKVFKKLDELSASSGASISNVITIDGDPNEGRRKPMFKCTYVVDGKEVAGESHEMEYAKLEAAGKAYTLITEETFPKTVFFIGNDCKDDYEYTYNETEVYHIDGGQINAVEASGESNSDIVGESRALVVYEEKDELGIDKGESAVDDGEDQVDF